MHSAAVRFFASDDAAWITGQTISVDGGHSRGRADDDRPNAVAAGPSRAFTIFSRFADRNIHAPPVKRS